MDPTDKERLILHELKQVKNYPFDSDKDLEHIRLLMSDYQDVDILEQVKRWRTYKLDKPLEKKSNPRSQFRNWCSKAMEFAKQRQDKTQGQPPTPNPPTVTVADVPEDWQKANKDLYAQFRDGGD